MTKDLFDLGGRVAIVTGSTKGIGRAIAEGLAAHGAKVVVSSRKAAACDQVAAAINAADGAGEAVAIPCNVSHRPELQALVTATREHWGQIDILVCNAAVNPYFGSSLEIGDDAFAKTLDVNILSNHWLCQLVVPEMAERGRGAVIVVSSIGGLKGSSLLGAYAISKAADMQLVRNLAVEFGPRGVRANCIAPGLVRTDFARALWQNEAILDRYTATSPLRRIGEPEEIAGAAVYLASDASSFMVGQTLVLDGGVTIRE